MAYDYTVRINKFIASSTSLSRRAADAAIADGRVLVDGNTVEQGMDIGTNNIVTLDNRAITPSVNSITIMLNKPRGYVVSRDGQGSKTIYDILPPEYQQLNPVGRLDKDSSGLLLLTNDGELANELTHPKYQKTKIYEVVLDKPLQPLHQQMISDLGIQLEDGLSQFLVTRLERGSTEYQVTMHEGRNRQIRRTFAALGYTVTHLHRTQFGSYTIDQLKEGALKSV